ncbi:MAG: hypothetical protein KJ622_12415 [Alphaproteobacteria bacterium]|nr:hypothetical protein [Alphaproteobacteria bacterium]
MSTPFRDADVEPVGNLHHADATSRRRLTSLTRGYDAAFVAGFGTEAINALNLAASFPHEIQGVVLFSPELPEFTRLPVVHRILETVAPAAQFLSGIFKATLGSARGREPCTGHRRQPGFGDVSQPVLIFSPRTSAGADIRVAGALQRNLGGPVEVRYVGPDAEIETLSPHDPHLARAISDFTARISAGAEGRRLKRLQSACNSHSRADTPQPARLEGRSLDSTPRADGPSLIPAAAIA